MRPYLHPHQVDLVTEWLNFLNQRLGFLNWRPGYESRWCGGCVLERCNAHRKEWNVESPASCGQGSAGHEMQLTKLFYFATFNNSKSRTSSHEMLSRLAPYHKAGNGLVPLRKVESFKNVLLQLQNRPVGFGKDHSKWCSRAGLSWAGLSLWEFEVPPQSYPPKK